MDTREKLDFRTNARRLCGLGAIVSIGLVAGCSTTPVKVHSDIKLRSETELAIQAIKEEWLKPCLGVGQPQENSIAGLLQDYTDAAAGFAICMRRHNSFVDYLTPVVAKEKAK